MTLFIPLEPLFILYTLQRAGFEAYIVGGAVRDMLLAADQNRDHLVATDFDFTTNATPEQILTVFPESFYENEFGMVAMPDKHLQTMMGRTSHSDDSKEKLGAKNQVIQLESATKLHPSLSPKEVVSDESFHQKNYEITTYRSEGVYSDHRRPDEVTWGKSIEEDVKRRDFTINAMALKVSSEKLSHFFADPHNMVNLAAEEKIAEEEYEVIDLYNGRADLEAKIIRTVGDAAERFEEDALRMLRAIRFSVQLNMKMTDEAFTAISALAANIQEVSWERIRDEFLKMLASDFPSQSIELLDDTGLLEFVLPEVLEGKGVEQGGHHTTDVWTHSLDALANCPSPDPIVRLATLLHDVAKPATYKLIDGKPTFYNHEIVGSRMAKTIAQRFRLSKRDIDRIFSLVRYHMFYYQPQNTDASIRRFMRKVGLENINDILDVREADRLGSGARETSWRLEEMKERMVEQLHQPFAITDLEIDGNDLMTELNLKPGPILGKILKELFEKVLDNPELNTKEQLLEVAKQLL